MEDLDPVEDIATPPHRRFVNILELRPSTETPSSSGTLRALSSMVRREKRKERDPMASVQESLSTRMAESVTDVLGQDSQYFKKNLMQTGEESREKGLTQVY